MGYEATPKRIVLLVIYILIMSTVNVVFTSNSYSVFTVGGYNSDIINEGVVGIDDFRMNLVLTSHSNMTINEKWDYMNDTYGTYKGVYYIWGGGEGILGTIIGIIVESGLKNVWVDENGIETYVSVSDFNKYLDGTLTTERGGLRAFFDLIGSVWDILVYILGLSVFKFGNVILFDGSSVPSVLGFIFGLMTLAPWLLVTFWIYPIITRLLQIVADWIPL